MSYTGQVGLHRINRDNGSKTYLEYRQRYVRLDDGGTGTNIAHRFGIGNSGSGCTLFNLKHITVKCSPIVFGTGAPQVPGTKALNICCTATTSTIDILGGSVDWGSQDGSTTAFVSATQSGGDSITINGIHTTGGVFVLSSGTALVGGSGAINQLAARGGVMRVENQTATINTLNAYTGGTVEYVSTGTITQIGLYGGTLDARINAGAFTVTDATIFEASKLLDPNRRITYTNPIEVYAPLSSVTLDLGSQASLAALIDFA
jgi:hypothetical protein